MNKPKLAALALTALLLPLAAGCGVDSGNGGSSQQGGAGSTPSQAATEDIPAATENVPTVATDANEAQASPTAITLGSQSAQTPQAQVTPLVTATDLASGGSGSGGLTPTAWVPPTAQAGTPIPGAVATLTAAPALQKSTLILTNSKGENFNMTVEVADTAAKQELGLMFRPSLPLDAGMLFDFGGDTTEAFWMANTILPLSIAFIKADGTIQDIADMQALDRNTTSPSGPYHYALETNQGYFKVHNLQPRDHVTIPSAQGLVIPGMPACAVSSTP